MSATTLAILGVGNILEKDDGIAVYATAYLENNFIFTPKIHIENGGVEGINLLNFFMEHSNILILDAITLDDEAGSIYHIPSQKLTGYGLNTGGAHEVGVIECIDMLELMDKPLPKSSILGIIPHTVKVHIGLSPLLEQKFKVYIKTVLSIVEKEGIQVEKRENYLSLKNIIDNFKDPQRMG